MTTVTATIAALAVLAGAGLLPVLALVGLRWITAPLLPLAGAVVAALAATGYLATGGTFMAWFVGLAVLGWVIVGIYWLVGPDRRPWVGGTQPAVPADLPAETARQSRRRNPVGDLAPHQVIHCCRHPHQNRDPHLSRHSV